MVTGQAGTARHHPASLRDVAPHWSSPRSPKGPGTNSQEMYWGCLPHAAQLGGHSRTPTSEVPLLLKYVMLLALVCQDFKNLAIKCWNLYAKDEETRSGYLPLCAVSTL